MGRTAGIIAPAPEEPPDPSLEALTRAGLTPAQAYQAQVYMNRPMGQSTSQSSPQQFPRPSVDRQPPPNNLPQLGLNIDTDDGKLGIDFLGGGTPSDHSTDSSNELQWSQQLPRSHPNSVRSRISVVSGFAPIAEQLDQQPFASTSSRPYPLQLDTAVSAAHVTGASTSPASSTLAESTGVSSVPSSTVATTSGRRSSESSRTLPGPFRRDRAAQDRSRSMSATITPQVRAMLESGMRVPRPLVPAAGSGARDSSGSKPNRRVPIVYPALLSRVAQALKERIPLNDHLKDGLTYKDAFDGREAVDKIAYIIKTTDRNLALLLGRALDAQKFFHAVTYDHRLRDSSHDIYQFRTKVPSPFVSGELVDADGDSIKDAVVKAPAHPLMNDGQSGEAKVVLKDSPTQSVESSAEKVHRDGSPSPPDSVTSPMTRPRQGSISSDDIPLPSGVFTLLTDCYSPTCTRDQLCYSIACPRRMEQQARLNMKPQPGLKKQISRESLGDLVVRSLLDALFLVTDTDALRIGTRNVVDTFSASSDCGQRL